MHVLAPKPKRADLPLFFNVDSSVGTKGQNSSLEDVLLVQLLVHKVGEVVPEKEGFIDGFFSLIKAVWADKFRITTTCSRVPEQYRDVGVAFEFKPLIGGWDTSDDYEVTVTKIDPNTNRTSSVGSALQVARLDSEDLIPHRKGPNQY